MKKILIIDDNSTGTPERKSTYENVLGGNFELDIIEKPAELYSMIDSGSPDLYLIDIILTNWLDPLTLKPVDTLDVLKKLKRNVPVVLVSNEYKNILDEDTFTEFLNRVLDNGILVKSFFKWSQFMLARTEVEYKDSIIARFKIDILANEKMKLIHGVDESDGVVLGVIAALVEEMGPFMQKISKVTDYKIGNIVFQKGFLTTNKGEKITIISAIQNQMGMVDAAIISSAMISKLNIRNIVLIGVCGGRFSQNVNYGHLMIPSASIAWQKGKITEKGLIPDVGAYPGDAGLKQALMHRNYEVKKILKRIYNKYNISYSKITGSNLDVGVPEIHYEEMACGDLIISKPGLLDEIAEASGRPKLKSVEMESYAILRSGYYFLNTKLSVIKSVMDDTENKTDKYKNYACYLSANFLYEILFNGIYIP